MPYHLQTHKPGVTAPARRWARATFFLTAAVVCVVGWYAWSTGQAKAWILFAGLLALLLAIILLRSGFASRLLKEAGKQVIHSQARALRSALQTSLQRSEHMVETQGNSVGVELKKLASQTAKELDLAANRLKRDLASSSRYPASPLPLAGGPICSSCGQPLRIASRFCDRCGELLVRSCPRCGWPARSAVSRFCDECGASLEG